MTIDVDIQVQGGKVTITVGGQPVASAGDGTIVSQGNVGGAADAGKKGGDGLGNIDPGGGPGGGALVIGPIVVGCVATQAAAGQSNGGSGKKGGDGLGNIDPGGGGPGGGTLVIGPIVIGGTSAAAGSSSAQGVNIGPAAKS